MSASLPMRCPECGEDAILRPPSDLVPWEAHGLPQPGWSHRDGTSLCPVIGPSGGYQPARPEPAHQAARAARLAPPAGIRQARAADLADRIAGHLGAGPGPRRPAAPGRQHAARVIARLGQIHRQAQAGREAEPEAGG